MMINKGYYNIYVFKLIIILYFSILIIIRVIIYLALIIVHFK